MKHSFVPQPLPASPHMPPEQLPPGQASPHTPQLFGSIRRFDSQPGATSQFWNGSVH